MSLTRKKKNRFGKKKNELGLEYVQLFFQLKELKEQGGYYVSQMVNKQLMSINYIAAILVDIEVSKGEFKIKR